MLARHFGNSLQCPNLPVCCGVIAFPWVFVWATRHPRWSRPLPLIPVAVHAPVPMRVDVADGGRRWPGLPFPSSGSAFSAHTSLRSMAGDLDLDTWVGREEEGGRLPVAMSQQPLQEPCPAPRGSHQSLPVLRGGWEGASQDRLPVTTGSCPHLCFPSGIQLLVAPGLSQEGGTPNAGASRCSGPQRPSRTDAQEGPGDVPYSRDPSESLSAEGLPPVAALLESTRAPSRRGR